MYERHGNQIWITRFCLQINKNNNICMGLLNCVLMNSINDRSTNANSLKDDEKIEKCFNFC